MIKQGDEVQLSGRVVGFSRRVSGQFVHVQLPDGQLVQIAPDHVEHVAIVAAPENAAILSAPETAVIRGPRKKR